MNEKYKRNYSQFRYYKFLQLEEKFYSALIVYLGTNLCYFFISAKTILYIFIENAIVETHLLIY
jgi:hypothetical protein